MRNFQVIAVVSVLVVSLTLSVSCGEEKEAVAENGSAGSKQISVERKTLTREEMTDSQRESYAIGMDIGVYLKQSGQDVDLDVFIQAISDTLKGRELLLSNEEADRSKRAFFAKVKRQQRKQVDVSAEENLKQGQAFLAENKNKEGVITTESGLQYIVLKEGDGPHPKITDRVKAHYRGTLIDGTEFDSSYKRGKPYTFSVRGVIKGWIEAVQIMKVGSKYKLFIPSDIAYGKKGGGPIIGPNCVLIFELELLGIE